MNEGNELLRAHVTRVGFDLSLGRTHIAALVYLNESITRREYIASHKAHLSVRRAFAHFAGGAHGCEERGLIVHHYRQDKRDSGIKWHYTITKAGKLVIELLREAGIYQEYAEALPHLEAVS